MTLNDRNTTRYAMQLLPEFAV